MDINLPGINGFEATRIILEQVPATKVMGYSLHKEPFYARKMVATGASGYIPKTASIEEMKEALLCIYNNQTYICMDLEALLKPTAPPIL
jgi:DNA-binding NarL/FixJ family response regulator